VSVGLGQLVSWPQVLKLRCEPGEGISLASYRVVLMSMTLFLIHRIAISDAVTIVSVPLALVPNLLITAMLISRRGDIPNHVRSHDVPRTARKASRSVWASSAGSATAGK
jgi:uncharacterized protein with PQ loop repeat